jgi:hypothetical protein
VTRVSTRRLRTLLALLALACSAAWAAPTISIEPSPVVVSPGETVSLRAEVQGPSEYRLRWILQGPLGGAGDIGSITQDGVYTAPAGIPRGPVRIVVQVSLGQYNLPVAAASVPVDVFPAGMKPPAFPAARPGLAPPPPRPAFAPSER